MNIKTTINDNPVYFYEIPVGDIFVCAGKANIKCVLVKTDTVYNEDRTAVYNALPITHHCGYPEYFTDMEKVSKVKNAILNVDI